MRLKTVLAAASLLPVMACTPAANDAQARASSAPASALAVHPQSGLPVIGLTVHARGKAHAFRVEVAKTSAEQVRGLMFRQSMGADEGMLFPMEPPRMASFWMHNTVLPLDIIYIGKDRRVLNIAHGQPYDETPLPSDGFAIAVLELNAGRAAALGIEPGDTVEW